MSKETKGKAYAWHKASEIFPMMDEDSDAWKEFVADIKENGLQEPIVLLDEKIIDGRNRHKACLEAGVKPRFVSLDKCDSPTRYVMSRNQHRRHMNASQRALAAARAIDSYEEEAAARQKAGVKAAEGAAGKSSDFVAKDFNVSARSVISAKKVLEDGSAALVQAVELGEVAVSDAAAITELPKAEQTQAVKAVQSGGASTVSQAAGVKGKKKKKKIISNGAAISTFSDLRDYIGRAMPRIKEMAKRHPAPKFSSKLEDQIGDCLITVSEWAQAAKINKK